MRKRAAVVIVMLQAVVASADAPKVAWGSLQTSRKLDTKPVTAVLDGARDKLRNCTVASGRVTVKFMIDGEGKLSSPKVTGMSEDVGQCVVATLTKLAFAKPADGRAVQITVPLTFGSPPTGAAFAELRGTGDVSSGFDDTNIYGGLLGNEAGEAHGTGGLGGGGGGSGWGTIGTGRYGGLGHGSGTGSGYGVGGGRGGMRGKTASVPSVSIGLPEVNGDLDKAIIRRYIKRNIQKIQYCYEKQLALKKGLAGTVTVKFKINAAGIVTESNASGMKDTDVETCIADVIHGIEFPKPKSGEVAVTYPFTFRPAESN